MERESLLGSRKSAETGVGASRRTSKPEIDCPPNSPFPRPEAPVKTAISQSQKIGRSCPPRTLVAGIPPYATMRAGGKTNGKTSVLEEGGQRGLGMLCKDNRELNLTKGACISPRWTQTDDPMRGTHAICAPRHSLYHGKRPCDRSPLTRGMWPTWCRCRAGPDSIRHSWSAQAHRHLNAPLPRRQNAEEGNSKGRIEHQQVTGRFRYSSSSSAISIAPGNPCGGNWRR